MRLLQLLLCVVAISNAADLKVVIDDIVKDSGSVYIGVYDKDEKFTLPDKEVKKALVPAGKTKIAGTFKNLPLGESYAVFAYQDMNGNGVLDRDKLGNATEPIAFSNQTKKGFQNYLRSCFILKNETTVELMLRRD